MGMNKPGPREVKIEQEKVYLVEIPKLNGMVLEHPEDDAFKNALVITNANIPQNRLPSNSVLAQEGVLTSANTREGKRFAKNVVMQLVDEAVGESVEFEKILQIINLANEFERYLHTLQETGEPVPADTKAFLTRLANNSSFSITEQEIDTLASRFNSTVELQHGLTTVNAVLDNIVEIAAISHAYYSAIGQQTGKPLEKAIIETQCQKGSERVLLLATLTDKKIYEAIQNPTMLLAALKADKILSPNGKEVPELIELFFTEPEPIRAGLEKQPTYGMKSIPPHSIITADSYYNVKTGVETSRDITQKVEKLKKTNKIIFSPFAEYDLHLKAEQRLGAENNTKALEKLVQGYEEMHEALITLQQDGKVHDRVLRGELALGFAARVFDRILKGNPNIDHKEAFDQLTRLLTDGSIDHDEQWGALLRNQNSINMLWSTPHREQLCHAHIGLEHGYLLHQLRQEYGNDKAAMLVSDYLINTDSPRFHFNRPPLGICMRAAQEMVAITRMDNRIIPAYFYYPNSALMRAYTAQAMILSSRREHPEHYTDYMAEVFRRTAANITLGVVTSIPVAGQVAAGTKDLKAVAQLAFEILNGFTPKDKDKLTPDINRFWTIVLALVPWHVPDAWMQLGKDKERIQMYIRWAYRLSLDPFEVQANHNLGMIHPPAKGRTKLLVAASYKAVETLDQLLPAGTLQTLSHLLFGWLIPKGKEKT